MDCNHDFSESHYCPKCGAFDQDVAQEMADSIAELKPRLESEEAHYTRLVEQLAEEKAKNERLESALRNFATDPTLATQQAALEALQEGEQNG